MVKLVCSQNPSQDDGALESIIKQGVFDSKDSNLMSQNGLKFLMKELIGRNILNEEFLGVKIEENLELLIDLARDKFNLTDEKLFRQIDEESIKKFSKITKTTDVKSETANYVTNLTSSQLFLNLQKAKNIKNEEFEQLAYDLISNSVHVNKLLHGFNYDIFEVIDNINTITNSKNSTKLTKVKLENIENSNKNYKMIITTTPLTGIKLEDAVIHWNIGMYKYFLENCKNVQNYDSSVKIDELTRSWTFTVTFSEKKQHKSIFDKYNPYKALIRRGVKIKIRELQLESDKIEELKESKLKDVEMQFKETNIPLELMRNSPTTDHLSRVTYKGVIKLVQLGASTKTLSDFIRGCLIHDIAKNAVPDQILGKKGKFTDSEYKIMQHHAEASEEIMIRIGFPLEVARIGSEHQTNYDGGAYPAVHPIRDSHGDIIDTRNPKKSEISLNGYVARFVDGLDALLSYRFYDDENSMDQVTEIFQKDNKKGVFHPLIGEFGINHFMKTLKELNYTPESYSSDTSKPISNNEKEILKFCLGYSTSLKVPVNSELQKLVDTHQIDYGTIEDRLTCLGINLRKTYNSFSDDDKELFKRGIPNSMREYIPEDGIPYT